MIAFPNCKINLGLQVLQKRGDGFHDLATVFYPVPLKDALEIITSPQADSPAIAVYGLTVQGDASDNLCIKAWQLLQKDFPSLPRVKVHLLKNIPMGAGLGGGSADAAFMLRLLNDKFRLGLSTVQLLHYAGKLGSDCPFFILNQPCVATGRGEVLKPVQINLSGYQLVLVSPGIHVSTGWAFSQLAFPGGSKNPVDLETIVLQPAAAWKQYLYNDFEPVVFAAYPALQSIKDHLYELGALYASMSGSGSTVFGIFSGECNLPGNLPVSYRVIRL